MLRGTRDLITKPCLGAKQAAKVVGLSSSVYNQFSEARDSSLGSRLREVSFCVVLGACIFLSSGVLCCATKAKQAEMKTAWKSACAYEDTVGSVDLENAEMLCSEDNEDTLPQPRQNKRWFCEKYCGGRGSDRDAAQSVWDLVTLPAPLETIAMIACIPTLAQRFYSPEVFVAQAPAREGVALGSIEHKVVGAPATAQSASALIEFMVETLRSGVRLTPPPLRCRARTTACHE